MTRHAVALAFVALASTAHAQTVVPAGANLQAALDAAQPGQTLLLEAGAVFVGNYVLPVKPAGPPIIVRGASSTARPTIRTPNSTPALRTAGATRGWELTDLIFAAGASQGAIVLLGDGTTTTVAGLPADITLDRVWITADTSAKNGLELHAVNVTVRHTSITGVKLAGIESHAIIIWNGPGPFLIEDNYIEAGSCGFFVGGAKPSVPGLIPSDIVFRRNVVTRPLVMRSQTGWAVKNLLELKNAQRVTITGNTFTNNWPDGQAGFAIVFTVRANSTSAPWSTIRDVLFESNVVRHSALGFNILGLDNERQVQSDPTSVHPSVRMDGLTIRNNLLEDVSRATYTSPRGEIAGTAGLMQIDEAPLHLVVENNTMLGDGNILSLGGSPIPGFIFRRNIVRKVVTPYQSYGVFGNAIGEGNAALNTYTSGATFTENVLAGATASAYSQYPGNTFPTLAVLAASFDSTYRSTLAGGADMAVLERAQLPTVIVRGVTGLRVVHP